MSVTIIMGHLSNDIFYFLPFFDWNLFNSMYLIGILSSIGDIYFILGVTIQNSFHVLLLTLPQFWPLGTLSDEFMCPLDMLLFFL